MVPSPQIPKKQCMYFGMPMFSKKFSTKALVKQSVKSVIYVLLLGYLSGCSVPYYHSAVSGHLKLLRQRVPLEEALRSSSLSQQRKQKLDLFKQVRQFAFEKLLLPDNKSYKHYVSLEDKYVVWNLVATPEFSLEPKQFCFLVVGCLQYKGFFQQKKALEAAEFWQQQGFDVSVGGVRAYSTLGWLPDPLLSSQLELPEHIMISVLFHELAHQKLYAKDDSSFNEAFAEAVAEYGVRLWYQQNGQDAELRRLDGYNERVEAMRPLLERTRYELEALYTQSLPDAQMRLSKQLILDNFKRQLTLLKVEWDGYSGFDHWLNRSLNNAHFTRVGTYQHWLPAFRALLGESSDISQFYRKSEQLASLPFAQRQIQLQGLKNRFD